MSPLISIEIVYVKKLKALNTTRSVLLSCLPQIQRYNILLKTIKTSLVQLEKGIKGLVVMSSDLEEVFDCIHGARVPTLWGKAYPSQKPLGAWTRDLSLRVDQFSQWATTTHPPVLFWLSGFTFPTGFLTAVLQTAARKNNVCYVCVCLRSIALCMFICMHSGRGSTPQCQVFGTHYGMNS